MVRVGAVGQCMLTKGPHLLSCSGLGLAEPMEVRWGTVASSSSSSPSLSSSLVRMSVLCAALRMVPKRVEEKTLEELSLVTCLDQLGVVGVDRVEVGVVTLRAFIPRASSKGILFNSALSWPPLCCAMLGSDPRDGVSLEWELELEWDTSTLGSASRRVGLQVVLLGQRGSAHCGRAPPVDDTDRVAGCRGRAAGCSCLPAAAAGRGPLLWEVLVREGSCSLV